ncbi:MAG: hypothetical protein RIB45_01255 [Marivibrio sp.]|uniref:hypothetical protein n=1 Tax=Marivibrio sp. TaxID=2039719 RepID=UPI0032EE0DF8
MADGAGEDRHEDEIDFDELTVARLSKLGGGKSTWFGWGLMFLLLVDLLLNALGELGFTMIVAAAALSLFGLDRGAEDAGTAFVLVLVLQVAALSVAQYLIRNSVWKVHLGFALRESVFFLLFRPQNQRDLRGVEPEGQLFVAVFDVAVLLFVMSSFLELEEPLARWMVVQLGMQAPGIWPTVAVAVVLAAFSWVVGAVLRKAKDDRSIIFAVLFASAAGVLCAAYDPGAGWIPPAMRSAGLADDFGFWQVLLLGGVSLSYATLAFSAFEESDSLNVRTRTTPPRVVAETTPELRNLPSKAYRANLNHISGQIVVVLSRSWSNRGRVYVHGDPSHLPIVARKFIVVDLSRLSHLLDSKVDFRTTTMDGKYVIEGDLELRPRLDHKKVTALLNEAAVDDYLSLLLEHRQGADDQAVRHPLVKTISEHMVRAVDDILLAEQRTAFGRGEKSFGAMSLGEMRQSIRDASTQILRSVRAVERDALDTKRREENFGERDIEQYIDEVVSGFQEMLRSLVFLFDPSEINRSVASLRLAHDGRSRIELVIRQALDWPSERAPIALQEIKRDRDEWFDHASVDFLLDTIPIELTSIRVSLSPEMQQLQAELDDLNRQLHAQLDQLYTHNNAISETVYQRLMDNQLFSSFEARRMARERQQQDRLQAERKRSEPERLDHAPPSELDAPAEPDGRAEEAAPAPARKGGADRDGSQDAKTERAGDGTDESPDPDKPRSRRGRL